MAYTLDTGINGNILTFAGQIAILSQNHTQMKEKTTALETSSTGTGLRINYKTLQLKTNCSCGVPVTFLHMRSVVAR